MRIVSRYLLVQFAGATAVALLVLCTTVVAMDVLLHIDEFGDDARAALRDVLAGALELVPHGIPLAAVIGVAWSLTRATRFREITAIRCGGIPLRSALLPILIACVLLAGSLAVVQDRLIVPARLALQGGGQKAERDPFFNRGRWWFATGASVFSARDWSPVEATLVDVIVFEFDSARQLRRRIDALHARFVRERVWDFEQATVRSFEQGSDLSLQRVPRLELDLGLSGPEVARALPAVEHTTLHKLARYIREQSGDPLTLARLEAEFHGRLTQTLWTLVLVLLAIPLAIGDAERGDSLPRALLGSIGTAGLFWLAWIAASQSGRSGLWPAALPLWSVTLLFLFVGAWRFRAIKE